MNLLDTLLLLALATTVAGFLLGGLRAGGWITVGLYAGQLLLLVLLTPELGTVGAASALELTVFDQALSWRLTGLGWFFALLTVGAALASAMFSAGAWSRGRRSLRLFHGSLAVNVLAMLTLLASGDLLSLFVGWELVSWASFLIMTQLGGEAARAAFKYLIYAMIGAMAVLAAMILSLELAGSLQYDAVRAALADAPTPLLWALVLLYGAGFGIKMALFPAHRWQAAAYSESPGPAAAFLGAISSRMGLFALLVVLVELVGLPALQSMAVPFTFLDASTLWAWVAALTMIIPTYIALTQTDARMLLAWHGIGQSGYMLLGIMVTTPMGVAGGLLHVFNYATYQAALFLSVTAIVYRTGTADLDRLGGLINRMPLSFITMLVGIIGLAGLPPMNGFVSKWLIYKSLLDEGMPLLFLAAVVGTLGTILSVYKLIHNSFLGQLRAEHAQVREVPWTMTAPMLVLAGLAFLTGLMPGLALELVDRAQAAMGLALMPHHLGGVNTAGGNLDMLWVNGALIGAIGVGALVFLMGNRRHVTHQYDNYAGGHFLSSDVRFHYSHNFYPGVMRVIGPLYRGSVRWLEEAVVSLTEVVADGSAALYRAAPAQLYLLVATVLVLWWSLGG